MIADFHTKHPAFQRDAFFMTTDARIEKDCTDIATSV